MLIVTACSGSAERATAAGAEAQELLSQNRIYEARLAIQRAIGQRDDILALHLLRARIELAAGSPNGALSAYEDAVALDASNPEALNGIALNSLQVGDIDKSEAAVDKLLTIYPDEVNTLLIRGLIKVLRHRGEEALAASDRVLRLRPNVVEGSLLKARALHMLGQRDEALAVLLKARESAGSTPEVVQALSEMYRDRDDGDRMVEQLEILRTIKGGDPTVVIDEANALYKLGEPDRARSLLWQAILDKQTTKTMARDIAALWDEYDRDALSPAQVGEIARRAKPEVRREIGWYYMTAGKPDLAEAAIGNLPESDALRANILITQGKIDAGLSLASGILAEDRTNCEALLAKTSALIATKRSDQAVVSGQSAIAQCPLMVPAYIALAQAKIDTNKGDPLPADLVYRDGLRHNPQSLRLAKHYTSWLEQRGEPVRAMGVARALTRSAPALNGGWRLYLEICQRNITMRCVKDAEAGLKAAKQRYAIDIRPDEPAPIKLFGRLDRD